MAIKVGVPRGMYFYKYYPFIQTFLTELGAEVVPSPETTKEILDKGVLYCIDDACLPVKVYHGHASSLKDKVDRMLVPRLTSVSKGEYICPKFGGLPEMVKYSVPELPPLIDTEINLMKGRRELSKALYKMAFSLNFGNPLKIKKSLDAALRTHEQFKESVHKGNTPDNVIMSKPVPLRRQKARIGLIGHPYLLYDSFINMSLIKKLRDRGVEVITPDMIDPQVINERCMELSKRMFWSSGKSLIGSALYVMDNSSIDGMLSLTAFGCGVDSLAGEFIERYARKNYKKPYMVLNIDEH
ncbi:MAG TPA: acyl-CoA dehydratase activase-related protein, partial [Candidatus Nitrosocosmicus sp.]|nr:acyl-CoA dehydratase activase-related protein [Candidatus Nitrosocosmicus sp.]